MADETPLESESQFLDNFMAICAMVEEMYNEFKKGKVKELHQLNQIKE